METSVKAAKVLVPPQPSVASPSLDEENVKGKVGAAACDSSSDFFDPMMEFSRQLEDIISAHGSAATLLDKQSSVEAETEKMKEEAKDDVGVTTETEVSLIMQSLNKLSSPEEKLQDVVRKYAEQVAVRRCDEQRLGVLQQLQAERRSSIMARAKLEALCRELQSHYGTLREETLRRCREDEEKRKEITGHFQKTLTEIQAQIEQHSARNDKLCRENSHLTEKLESLMNQCELREESLEKIERHRDLQHKLTEAKLQQANALLAEAEEKHKREKEYLLREAIEKTKKCFAMKEQELSMKKKLTLYAQKFDEFQVTLAKSNEIYARFKKEMDNMSDKMKKMEKESNLWKTRFENCNKALIDMMEERTAKGKEYDLFVLKIQRLEKLCQTLQEERRVLYSKIKEVHQTHSNPPSEVCQVAGPDAAGRSVLLSPMEVRELQEDDPVLTEDMARLKEEQAKLQEFATTLLSTSATEEKEEEENKDLEPEEDLVTAAFAQFKTKPQVNKEPETVEEPQNVPKPEAPTPEEKAPEMTPTDLKPEKAKVETRVEVEEEQQVEPDQQIPQQQTSRQEPAPEAGISKEPEQVEPAVPAEDGKPQHQPAELALATESPESTSESAPPPENTLAAPPSTADSSKKQAPKKKKKRGGKNSS